MGRAGPSGREHGEHERTDDRATDDAEDANEHAEDAPAVGFRHEAIVHRSRLMSQGTISTTFPVTRHAA